MKPRWYELVQHASGGITADDSNLYQNTQADGHTVRQTYIEMNKCRARLCLSQLCCVYLNPLLYSRKYWRELNLAVGSQIAFARILTDLNLAVWHRIGICIYASKILSKIAGFNLAVVTADYQNCQIEFPAKFSGYAVWINRYYQLTNEVAWYCTVSSRPKILEGKQEEELD